MVAPHGTGRIYLSSNVLLEEDIVALTACGYRVHGIGRVTGPIFARCFICRKAFFSPDGANSQLGARMVAHMNTNRACIRHRTPMLNLIISLQHFINTHNLSPRERFKHSLNRQARRRAYMEAIFRRDCVKKRSRRRAMFHVG